MNKQTYKKLIDMAKKVVGGLWISACLMALMVLVAPCFLIFTVGKDGELTIWNFVGLVWCLLVAFVFKYKSR